MQLHQNKPLHLIEDLFRSVIQRTDIKNFKIRDHGIENSDEGLGIMKDGQLECNDTIPQLKEKYHTGFTVKLKLKQKNCQQTENNTDQLVIRIDKPGSGLSDEDMPDSIVMQTYPNEIGSNSHDKMRYGGEDENSDEDSLDYVKEILEKKYDGILKDEHPGLLHYHVKPIQSSRKSMSKLFEDMEELKNKCSIIEDYIVTETTVEDVFLTVAKADSNNGSSSKSSGSSSEKSSKASSKKNSKSSSENSSNSYIV